MGEFKSRQQLKIAIIISNLYILCAESEPVHEPTNHRCEECDKIFPTAEELTFSTNIA
jgi:hypothetical protein